MEGQIVMSQKERIGEPVPGGFLAALSDDHQ